jgi:N-acylglucosamine-6-phosphate 2-epimerase
MQSDAILEALRGGLIVSVQAEADSALNEPSVIAVLARVAQAGGAVGVRIEGVERIRAVRAAVRIPIIGIIKHKYGGFDPYITTTAQEVEQVVEAGAQIAAFDATHRERVEGASVARLVDLIHARGRIAMADCATAGDGRRACVAGADLVATTLAGYTLETLGRRLPAVDLVAELAKLHPFAICEGGVSDPREVRAALDAGAGAVVVGTAVSNIDALVRRFAAASDRAREQHTS